MHYFTSICIIKGYSTANLIFRCIRLQSIKKKNHLCTASILLRAGCSLSHDLRVDQELQLLSQPVRGVNMKYNGGWMKNVNSRGFAFLFLLQN